MRNYKGSCHCGAIAYSFNTELAPDDWSIRACQCSFCLAHSALSTSDPRGALRFTAPCNENLQRYRFGLATADFLLCKECGVYIGAYIATDSGAWGIINTRTLVAKLKHLGAQSPMDYDNENTQSRIARREQRWTPAIITDQE